MLNYLVKFFICLSSYIIIDKYIIDRLFGYKIKGKYYLVHFINNMIIVYLTLPDVLYTYTNFINFIDYSSNYDAAILTYSLHFYHTIVYYKKLRFDDWLHHFLMVVVVLPIGTLINCGSLLGHGLFYTTGLPGGIDYLLLFLVRINLIGKLIEKRINKYINLWFRNPGLTAHATLTLVGYHIIKHTMSNLYCFGFILTGFIIFWNGVYFMEQVVVDYTKVSQKNNISKKIEK